MRRLTPMAFLSIIFMATFWFVSKWTASLTLPNPPEPISSTNEYSPSKAECFEGTELSYIDSSSITAKFCNKKYDQQFATGEPMRCIQEDGHFFLFSTSSPTIYSFHRVSYTLTLIRFTAQLYLSDLKFWQFLPSPFD